MGNVIGRFYFKQTNNRNLLGEYSNNGSIHNASESSDFLKSDSEDKFIGEFKTTWFENGANLLTLEIIYKVGSNNKLYTLQWKDKSGTTRFYGEGFLVDDILIGDYRDL